MPNLAEDTSINKKSVTRLFVFLGLIILIVTVWLWWTKVHNSQQNVFWGMISNNLASNGVTRHVVQKTPTESLDQYIQLEFGSVNASHGLSTLKQREPNGQTTVKTETLGTPANDYNRYISVDTPQKTAQGQSIDSSKFTGIWAKNERPSNLRANINYFSQSALTIVPYGNLSSQARKSLVNFIKDSDVYIMSKSATSTKYNGRPAYVYYVDVNPDAYIDSLGRYAKALGLGNVGLNSEQYSNSPPLKVELTVDKLSRRLVRIYYPDSKQEETFMAQGLQPQTQVPTKTVNVEELQKRIRSSQQ